MKILVFVLIAVLSQMLINCASTPPKKKPAVVAPYDAKKELAKIQVEIGAGGEKKAISKLRNLIAKNPKSDVADDATMILAKIYYKNQQWEPAYQAYMSLVNSDVLSPNEGEALLGASRSLAKAGRLDEALSLSARGLKIPGLNESTKLDFQRHRFTMLANLGDRMDALKTLAYISDHETKPEIKANAQARANEIVGLLNENDLEKLTSDSEFGFVRPQAAYRLALMKLQSKDFDGARSVFVRAAEWGKGTPIESQSLSYINQIDSRRKVEAFTIGTILPLTGKYAPIGQKTLKGLQLGLGIYGPERSQFKLAVGDSEGTPEGARRAVEKLVTEDNVIAIVGSLLSRTASAVAAKTEELGVPSFALSQKSGLTESGAYIFRNAVTSEMQVRELVRLSMENLGYKNFAILYPNDPYGIEYANIFWDEVLARGGTIAAAQIYSSTETDFRGPIKRLVGTYYLEDRKNEYQARLRNWYKKQKSIKTRQAPPDDLLPPIADFDAIFVPDGPKAIGQIAPMLAYQGVTNVRLLGTNIWNSAEFVRRGQKNVENSLFVDSTLANDVSFKTSRFYTEFKRVFGEDPGLFEVQGYEVGLLLRQVIGGGEHTRLGLVSTLSSIRQYQGISGPMSMNQNRELVRPLIPFMVRNGEISQWNPSLEVPEPGKSKSVKK